MRTVELSYQIELLTPLHIGTGTGFAKMVDDMICRTAPMHSGARGLPYIPGSSLKGKARSRCEAIAHSLTLSVCEKGGRVCKHNPCVICRIFGSAYHPGRLRFSDALLSESWQTLVGRQRDGHAVPSHDLQELSTIRTGTKIDRVTRTVAQDFLFALEHAAEGLQFEGAIRGSVDDRDIFGERLSLPVEVWVLILGLRLIEKLGGGRSRGLGRCRLHINCVKIDDGDNIADALPHEDCLLGVSDYEASSMRLS